MAKHVHVHIHRTVDAEYQRDKDGKFATTGSAGGGANHHHERMGHHQSEMSKKGPQHPDHPAHAQAAVHHQRARNALEYANEAGSGRHAHHEHMAVAQLNANEADKHEGKVAHKPWDGKEKLRKGHIVRIEGETEPHKVLESDDDKGEMPRVLVQAHQSKMAIKPTERVDRKHILPHK